MDHYFWILVWVGYFKSEPLWSEIAVMDQYYDITEDRIYEFLNQWNQQRTGDLLNLPNKIRNKTKILLENKYIIVEIKNLSGW